jgi:hypothetical protein
MAASTNNLSLLLNQQDSSSVNIINRSIGAVSYGGSAGEFEKRTLAADTSIHTLDQPTAVVLQFYFKNTDAAALILLTGTVQDDAVLVREHEWRRQLVAPGREADFAAIAGQVRDLGSDVRVRIEGNRARFQRQVNERTELRTHVDDGLGDDVHERELHERVCDAV